MYKKQKKFIIFGASKVSLKRRSSSWRKRRTNSWRMCINCTGTRRLCPDSRDWSSKKRCWTTSTEPPPLRKKLTKYVLWKRRHVPEIALSYRQVIDDIVLLQDNGRFDTSAEGARGVGRSSCDIRGRGGRVSPRRLLPVFEDDLITWWVQPR